MIKIVQQEDKVLRKIAKPVPINEITGTKIKKVLSDMKQALDSQGDGVAIAAPQIGVSLRIFVLSKKAFEMPDEESKEEKESKDTSIKKMKEEENLVFINPEIVKSSKKRHWIEEGCLSVRWIYGDVYRSTNATIRAYDELGNVFVRGAGGLLAQIFQHETDHLNGILFIDKAEDLEEVHPSTEHTSES